MITKQTTWQIDPMHSNILFKVKHANIALIAGAFTGYRGVVQSETEDFARALVTLDIDVNSINTWATQRDHHLLSPDFFDVQRFPKILFQSSPMKKVGDRQYELTGDLSIRDQTHPVALSVIYHGIVTDMFGVTRAGFELKGHIDRTDYGLGWQAKNIRGGGEALAHKVQFEFSIELVPAE